MQKRSTMLHNKSRFITKLVAAFGSERHGSENSRLENAVDNLWSLLEHGKIEFEDHTVYANIEQWSRIFFRVMEAVDDVPDLAKDIGTIDVTAQAKDEEAEASVASWRKKALEYKEQNNEVIGWGIEKLLVNTELAPVEKPTRQQVRESDEKVTFTYG